MPRYSVLILLLVIVSGASCGGSGTSGSPPSIPVVDFIKTFASAERRPADAYSLTDHSIQGENHPSIAAPAPGRIIWELRLPRRGVFHAVVAIEGTVPVRFRVGVSDDRIYEGLASTTVSSPSAWTDLVADLSAYAGWKWSLFYRPDTRAWRVVLSTDAVTGPGRAIWGAPSISTDTSGAREYASRLTAVP
jgi:hypothetical protein